ncbi:MAG: hypothetical protein JNM40_22270 [Myxococcales bacterium]|nr:hypothetical protein [Myxococcales bacterium]
MSDNYPVPGTYGGYWPQQAPQQPDQTAQLLGALLPTLIVQPALTASQTTIDAIKAELAAVPKPALAAGAQPTKPEFDAVRDYAIECSSVIDRGLGAGSAAIAAQRRSLFFSMITPLLSGTNGGGNNAMILVVLMMLLMGGGLPF